MGGGDPHVDRVRSHRDGNDVYTYYGPFVGRIWNYPAVIGVLEGTQTVLFTVVAVLVWRKVSTSWGLLSLFVVFPMTFFGANFGLGAPVIIALHLDNGLSTDALVAAATVVSISLCAFAVYGLSRCLPDAPVNRCAGVSRCPAPRGRRR